MASLSVSLVHMLVFRAEACEAKKEYFPPSSDKTKL